jgi:hypothetical protein
MTIDRVVTNLYTCCKCKHQWTRWNGNNNGNGNGDREAETATIPVTTTMPLPKRCPKCKCIRWNQRYLDEELALIDRLQDELYETGLIRESGEKIEYEGNETLGTKPRTISPYDYDFISYDFLKQKLPQPELFELRHVLSIPKEDIEARHDYMLSVIKDRVDNADVYEREYFPKYPHYGYSRRKIGFSIDNLWEPKKKKYFPGRRRIMSNSTICRHRPVHEIESKLYPDYDDGLYQRMYIELKEEIRV